MTNGVVWCRHISIKCIHIYSGDYNGLCFLLSIWYVAFFFLSMVLCVVVSTGTKASINLNPTPRGTILFWYYSSFFFSGKQWGIEMPFDQVLLTRGEQTKKCGARYHRCVTCATVIAVSSERNSDVCCEEWESHVCVLLCFVDLLLSVLPLLLSLLLPFFIFLLCCFFVSFFICHFFFNWTPWT